MNATEIIETLQTDFDSAAEWRRGIPVDHFRGGDDRNIEAVKMLEQLRDTSAAVPQPLLEVLGSLFDSCDFALSEHWSHRFRMVGFHYWPDNATQFVADFIADRRPRPMAVAS